jgi:hypothetical protein
VAIQGEVHLVLKPVHGYQKSVEPCAASNQLRMMNYEGEQRKVVAVARSIGDA